MTEARQAIDMRNKSRSWRVVATVTKTHDPGTSRDDESFTVVEPGEYPTRRAAEAAAEDRRWQSPPPDRIVEFSVEQDPEA